VRTRRATASRARRGVDVRIGVVGGDDIDPVDHRLADVGVQVEGDGERQIRPGDRAHAADDLRLRIGKACGHHRPVQGEHDAVGRQRHRDAPTQLPDEGVKRLAVGHAGRDAVGKEGRGQLDPAFAARIDHPAERVVDPGEGEQLVAPRDGETLERRRLCGEGVRLVHDATGDQAHRSSLCLPKVRGTRRNAVMAQLDRQGRVTPAPRRKRQRTASHVPRGAG
jgi:hypothetical protein